MKGAVHSCMLRRVACTRLPTEWGEFQAIGFQREICNGTRRLETAVALVLGELTEKTPLLRIHSQCLTGDVLGSLRCDCGEQLEQAMQEIAREGCGLLIYELQEGRGIGLMAKLQAYGLQDEGLDTVEANHALGFRADYRDFGLPVAILRDLGVSQVRLLSNNPRKSRALTDGGIEVVDRVPCEIAPNRHSLAYLLTKKQKMGHALRLRSRGNLDRAHQGRISRPSRRSTESNANRESIAFATIEEAASSLRAGRMIVVVDDEDRENEGDLVMAAEAITPEAINFMATHGRGLICLAMTGERLDELQITPMAPANAALHDTAFMVSIDAKGRGVTTGISARDRAATIRAVIDPCTHPRDLARPGHVFPLRSCPGGVLERRGHTEAAVDLAQLAGLYPAGVICEILNDDGTMARQSDLIRFCERHDLKMIAVADLVQYRLKTQGQRILGEEDALELACMLEKVGGPHA